MHLLLQEFVHNVVNTIQAVDGAKDADELEDGMYEVFLGMQQGQAVKMQREAGICGAGRTITMNLNMETVGFEPSSDSGSTSDSIDSDDRSGDVTSFRHLLVSEYEGPSRSSVKSSQSEFCVTSNAFANTLLNMSQWYFLVNTQFEPLGLDITVGPVSH